MGFLTKKMLTETRMMYTFYQLEMFSLFLSQYRTDFEYLQEIPILTLDVNEDFKGKKDRYDNMTEKVKFHKQNKRMILVYCQHVKMNSGYFLHLKAIS